VKRPGLGRGLDALIPQVPPPGGRSVAEIDISTIQPNPYQPRQAIDDDTIRELAESIRAHGILQPVVVRQSDSGYQLVAGERRWRAARAAGLATIPALVRQANDLQMLQVALVENLQRENINAMDAAAAYGQLMEEFGATQEEVAEAVGKSRTAVANTVRLLKLPPEIQRAVRENRLSEGHARALLALPSGAEMHIVWRKVEADGLSVRETESLVRRIAEPMAPSEPAAAPAPERDPNVGDLEQRLQRVLGTRVQIRPKRAGGTIQVTFTSAEDLQRIAELIEGARRPPNTPSPLGVVS